MNAVVRNNPHITREDLIKTKDLMDSAVQDSLVTSYDQLIDGIALPDPDDRHVVAAAVMTKASVIVTFNLKDFPKETLSKYRLVAVHPDAFIMDLFDIDPTQVLDAFRNDFESNIDPPLTFTEYIQSLRRSGLRDAPDHIAELSVLFDESTA